MIAGIKSVLGAEEWSEDQVDEVLIRADAPRKSPHEFAFEKEADQYRYIDSKALVESAVFSVGDLRRIRLNIIFAPNLPGFIGQRVECFGYARNVLGRPQRNYWFVLIHVLSYTTIGVGGNGLPVGIGCAIGKLGLSRLPVTGGVLQLRDVLDGGRV